MSFPLFLRSNNMGLHFSLAMLQVSTNETYFTLSFINFQKFLIHTQPPSPLSPFSVFSSYRWKFWAFRVAGSCPSSEETNKEVCNDTVLEYQPIGDDLLAKTPEGDRKRGAQRHGWWETWRSGRCDQARKWARGWGAYPTEWIQVRLLLHLAEGWQLSGHLGNARQKGHFPFRLQTRVGKQFSSSRNLEPMSIVNFSEGQTPLLFFFNVLTDLRVSAGMTGW